MSGTLFIDGIALWTPSLPGWAQASAALRAEARADVAAPPTPARRPAPALLAPNERRRASDTVLLALEVAGAAVADSGHDGAGLASVFCSAHGDLGITDALCRTLAQDPHSLSPTRFHHSVHNAASGYWSIARGCHAASTALSAFEHSFALGLLEAASQCAEAGAPRLLVGCDTEATGALASVNRSRGWLGVALVLSPQRGARSKWALHWTLTGAAQADIQAMPALRSASARALADNAMAAALPLFECLAAGAPSSLKLQVSASTQLTMELEPLDSPSGVLPAASSSARCASG
jgi:hypothetical protein